MVKTIFARRLRFMTETDKLMRMGLALWIEDFKSGLRHARDFAVPDAEMRVARDARAFSSEET